MNDQLKHSAYHEAGHVLIAYLVGYKCDYIKLNVNTEGDANSKFDYGNDLHLIAALTNYSIDPSIFDGLDKSTKNRSFDVGNRIVNTLLAGSVSETLFLHNFKTGNSVELELSGPDLLRSEQVHAFLLLYKKDHNSNYIRDTLSEQCEYYQIKEFSESLNKLAQEVLKKNDHTLDRAEIEAILNQTGFLSYITQYH